MIPQQTLPPGTPSIKLQKSRGVRHSRIGHSANDYLQVALFLFSDWPWSNSRQFSFLYILWEILYRLQNHQNWLKRIHEFITLLLRPPPTLWKHTLLPNLSIGFSSLSSKTVFFASFILHIATSTSTPINRPTKSTDSCSHENSRRSVTPREKWDMFHRYWYVQGLLCVRDLGRQVNGLNMCQETPTWPHVIVYLCNQTKSINLTCLRRLGQHFCSYPFETRTLFFPNTVTGCELWSGYLMSNQSR